SREPAMTNSSIAETSPPTQGDEVRIPAAIQVQMSFRKSGGEALGSDVHPGWTRDVSGTGLSITMHAPAKLADALDEHRDGLMAEIDLKMGGRINEGFGGRPRVLRHAARRVAPAASMKRSRSW
ncbi:MAG: hypothetical protein V3T05_09080, partial [Myxococcota bacterium]